MPSALLVIARNGEVISANRAASELLGYDNASLQGVHVRDISADAEDVWKEGCNDDGSVSDDSVVARHEADWTAQDGQQVPVLVSSTIQRDSDGEMETLVLLGVDLRDRRQLEVDLRHAQKLEAIGQLAAGIAHEINTPMQFIGDNVHFLSESMGDLFSLIEMYGQLKTKVGESDELVKQLCESEEDADLEYLQERMPKALERAAMGVERVTTIVAAMKAFSHPNTEKSAVNINDAVKNTLTVASNEYKYVADVETDLGDISNVYGHGGDLNQVLINLVVNAAHAIESINQGTESRGRIDISTSQDGDDVVIAVKDTGGGIPEHVRDRIFDPFFTTKEVGKGTGQGLSIVHSVVVDKHGGTLTFETELGKGTTFFVRLPVSGAQTGELAA